MEHTKGKVKVAIQNDGAYIYTSKKEKAVCRVYKRFYDCIRCEESEANAELIADAFNTTNESGLTPSELYKQNQELLDALEKSKDKIRRL